MRFYPLYMTENKSGEVANRFFWVRLTFRRNISCAIPEDVVTFLIWKDSFGKTGIHWDGCRLCEREEETGCTSPKRLAAFGTVNSVYSLIGKLLSVSSAVRRSGDDSSLLGYGNTAASKLVKEHI